MGHDHDFWVKIESESYAKIHCAFNSALFPDSKMVWYVIRNFVVPDLWEVLEGVSMVHCFESLQESKKVKILSFFGMKITRTCYGENKWFLGSKFYVYNVDL